MSLLVGGSKLHHFALHSFEHLSVMLEHLLEPASVVNTRHFIRCLHLIVGITMRHEAGDLFLAVGERAKSIF